MRTLQRPNKRAQDVFALCIQNVRGQDLCQRLHSIVADIQAGEDDYVEKARAATLHTFPQSDTVGSVTGKELVKVYTNRFVPKDCNARSIYDEIISSSPHDRCPICGVGQVLTLDHHLPKSKYPVLSVTPVNLVPACSWCQQSKKEQCPNLPEQQTLHPYFDDFENEIWLFAEVIATQPASFSFFAQQPNGWSNLIIERLRHHLQVFNLDRLFASNAAQELTIIRYSLQKLYDAAGSNGVRDHLSREADSREAALKNSWETAMYRAAAASNWFCYGGFSRA